MAKLSPGPRQRLVAAAADLLGRRGLNATSIRELAKHAKAPLGSTYHYFPGGKQQVVTEAVAFAGEMVVRTLAKKLNADPVEGLRVFFDHWRNIVTRSDYRAGCPVPAVSTQEPASAEGRAGLEAAAQVFESWESLIAESLRKHGADKRQAGQLATLIVASVEGMVAMCRASRSVRPLDHVARELEARVRAAIGR